MADGDGFDQEERLALLYDPLNADRRDLDLYVSIVDEVGGRQVLDIGCGTGTFACRLAALGIDVIGLDPDAASLAIARRKPGAEQVTWVHGDISALGPTQVDVVTMTANVAQHIVDDDEWAAVLDAAHQAVRPGGRLVFETRDPAQEAWRRWTRAATLSRVDVPGIGAVTAWVATTDVDGDLVTFGGEYTFERDGVVLEPEPTTLRFRTHDAVVASLTTAGFAVESVRDAPDRPGQELVFVAHRPT